MSRVHAERFTWTPLGATEPILDLSLDICPGERVLLVGASGAGKSTLLHALTGVLDEITPGTAGGVLTVDGQVPTPGRIGLVSQHPQDNRVGATVGRDAAFGAENLGLERDEIWRRVHQGLAATDFPYPIDHPARALSGGQMQRLALSGALVMEPGLLLLDEPVSMLDAASAAKLRSCVGSWLSAGGGSAPEDVTLIVADHDIAGWLGLVDRLVVLAGGRILVDGPIEQVLAGHRDALLDLGLWVPGAPAPLIAAPGEPLLNPVQGSKMPKRPPRTSPAAASGEIQPTGTATTDVLVRAEKVSVERASLGLNAARRVSRRVLNGVDAHVGCGEFVALHGPSGAGKSTLIGALTGLLPLAEGKVRWLGVEEDPEKWQARELASRLGWVPQFSEASVHGSTVLDSLLATCLMLGQDPAAARLRALRLLAELDLADKADRHPLSLSGGEQRRLAVATAVIHSPELVALDEPTVGLDRHAWARVAGVLLAARQDGASVLVASHDENLLALADRIAPLEAVPFSAAGPVPSAGAGNCLLAKCGSLALLITLLVFVPAGMISSGLVPLAVGAGALVAAAAAATRFSFPVIRLIPLLLAVLSVTWSNWLLSEQHSLAEAFAAGLRVVFIALPGVVATAYLDPVRLGDQLGQLLRLPPRPVLAVVVALQHLDDMHSRWQELNMARRARGLLPGRSPVARIRHGASALLVMLVDSVRQAARLSVAMESRGYSASLAGVRRTWAEPAVWSIRDTLLVFAALVLAGLPCLVACFA